MNRLCLHCDKRERLTDSNLCSVCEKYPTCEVCGIIFGERMEKISKKHPERCNSCADFEKFISDKCGSCGKKIPLFYSKKTYTLNYYVRGNFCSSCSGEASRRGRMSLKKGERSDFSGYLDILNRQMLEGKITPGLFDEARIANPQDINNPELLLTPADDGLNKIDL